MMLKESVRLSSSTGWSAVLVVVMLSLFVALPAAANDDFNEPFVFSNSFFRANGIEPTAVLGLPACGAGGVCDESSPAASHYSNVRVTSTLGAHEHSGDPTFVIIQGLVDVSSFTANAAGVEARETAEAFRVFFFPKANPNGLPELSPAASNLRQNNVLDTRGGYFSNDPLGLWVMIWVSWDGSQLSSNACQSAMDDLAADNGADLDGTPIVTTVSDIENLQAKACVTLRSRPSDGSLGARWLLCPTFKDPTDGVIRPDASLVSVPVHPEIDDAFGCLQNTHDWCN